jgi:hypothetical protein
MRTARTVEAEWWQDLRRSVSTGTKEHESSTERVWAAGFHNITARSRQTGVLKLTNRLFFNFSIFFGPRYTADNESVDTGAQMVIKFKISIYLVQVSCMFQPYMVIIRLACKEEKK